MYVPANPYFSEFSYGFAVTEDLSTRRRGSKRVAPVFPSLIEENQVGFDAMLDRDGIALYLQFKLAHCMTARAREARDGRIRAPFYRMHLRNASSQHSNLLELERSGEEVFYVAPRFHLTEDLNMAYSSRRVWNRSIQLRPSEIGDLDDRPHHVSFRESGEWMRCSEEPEVHGKAESPDAIIEGVEVKLAANPLPLHDYIPGLADRLLSIADQRRPFNPGWEAIDLGSLQQNLSPIQRVAFVARHFFDTQLFLIVEA